MAFSIRRIFSNINYFKKSDESPTNNALDFEKPFPTSASEKPVHISYESIEADSTSRQSSSLKLPESLKNYASKKGSLSDTDVFHINLEKKPREKRRKCKKLKVDIKKASQSMDELSQENTPKHVLLNCKSSEIFEGFNFNRSFSEFYESNSDERISLFDDESFSEDSDLSNVSKSAVKMCRKVNKDLHKSCSEINHIVPAFTPQLFSDMDKEQSSKLLEDYSLKLDELKGYTTKLLNNFQFQIDIHKLLESSQKTIHVKSRETSPAGSWNFINDKECDLTKHKIKQQLLSLKNCVNNFIHENFKDNRRQSQTNSTQNYGHKRITHKKKIKHYDYPDLRDAFLNLFHCDTYSYENRSDFDESDCSNCQCKCHQYSPSQSDSGLTSKSQDQFMSITSSIGNFSLDSTTLTAYSESLDQIVSYNSFQDTSLYNTLLQKSAIERITFYVQVHSIQLKCEQIDQDNQMRSTIVFHCGTCKYEETDENGLLRHILSQSHCENIHFVYKTAYIKKCVAAGTEIQPSTVLNPMRMYRDDNKIVCFGDSLYACSLCFENLIIGESVLMAHCADPVHIERRQRLSDIIG